MTEPRDPQIENPDTQGLLPSEETAETTQAFDSGSSDLEGHQPHPGETAAPAAEEVTDTDTLAEGITDAAPDSATPEAEDAAEDAEEETGADSAADGEILAAAREWGYVDDEGNVRLKGSERIVGQMKGDDPDKALRSFGQKFRQLAGKVKTLEREMEQESNKVRFLPRIDGLLEALPTAEAVGDLDDLTARLGRLQAAAQEQLEENLRRKETLCARAEELSESTDWKATTDAMKALQAEWKTVGPAPKEQAEEVWNRFRGAMDRFFERRKEHLENHDETTRQNLERKEALCVRAEELAGSTEWKVTAEAMKGLQDEWKATGPVPQHRSTELWGRFRGAMDQFFAHRKEHYDQLEKEQRENLRRKEALCVRAEELSDSDDWKETAEALKALQAEWKTIGPVPRKRAEALWGRFHGACDRFFTRRGTHLEQSRGDRERRQAEWRERLEENVERKREQVERLRESIGRDEENVQRWEGSLARVRPGPGADELRASLEEKISDVTGRIQSKRARLDELEESIRELSAKL